MLELWKPYLVLKDKNSPIVFNEIGNKIKRNKGFRPFVIFYDKEEHSYYYLKSRRYKISENPRKKRKSEILIPHSEEKGLFLYDSYVDCSQIFKIEADLLESLIDKENSLFKNTKRLSDEYISKIKEEMKKCIMEVPPYLSVVEVKLDDNGRTYGKSVYICNEKLIEVSNQDDDKGSYQKSNTNNKVSDSEYIKFKSLKNEKIPWQTNRYWAGINVASKILKEYFPAEVTRFLEVQGIEREFEKYKEATNESLVTQEENKQVLQKQENTQGVKLTVPVAGTVFNKKLAKSSKGNEYISFSLLIPNTEGDLVEKNGKMYKSCDLNVKDEFANCFVFNTPKTKQAFEAFKGVENRDFIRFNFEPNLKNGKVSLIVNKLLHLTKHSQKTVEIKNDKPKAKNKDREREM